MVMKAEKQTMNYTVKQVAVMAGVSVRTLHFYDEAGLLKPARIGANGYRYYGEAELLTLQQIRFYRELGFELKQIKRILSRPDFDKIGALESHRKVLGKRLTEIRKLLETIDNTIQHLKGTKKMNSQELFAGFNPETQAKHERYLIDRFGEGMKEGIAQSKALVKNWTKSDWEKSGRVFGEICQDLVKAVQEKLAAESDGVQSIIRRHHRWMSQFWPPTRESYTGHTLLITDSGLRKAYEAHDPQLPEFAAAAIKVFAERELS
jgi:DNA-binding transcriptional MerR regulator